VSEELIPVNRELTAAVPLVVNHLRELNRDPKLPVAECLGRARLLTAVDIRVEFKSDPKLRAAFLEVLLVSDAEIKEVSRGAR